MITEREKVFNKKAYKKEHYVLGTEIARDNMFNKST